MIPSESPAKAIQEAIQFIATIPTYETIAMELERLRQSNRLRYIPDLPDRGVATWYGHLLIGPAAVESGIVSLAGTLLHELFHRHQPPWSKPYSYWAGLFTGTHVWLRLESSAYQATAEFLEAVIRFSPQHAVAAWHDLQEMTRNFRHDYCSTQRQ